MNKKYSFFLTFLTFILLLLSACSSSETQESKQQRKWKQSSLFSSGSYTMIGEENKLGFIYDDSEVVRFYPYKNQKYMWHFWGNKSGDKLDVVATNEKSGKKVKLINQVALAGENNGADTHTPSLMSLPYSGMWKLDAYINDALFGSVFVKVHEAQK